MIHRISGMSNYFSFSGNDQTISIAGKQIIKQHLAQFTDITGATQNTDHFILMKYRNTQYHSRLLVHTTLQWIA